MPDDWELVGEDEQEVERRAVVMSEIYTGRNIQQQKHTTAEI